MGPGLGVRGGHPEQAGLQGQHLSAGLTGIEPGLLQGHADLAPGAVGILGHIDAAHIGLACTQGHERGQHAHRGRLTGAVRAEKAEHLARGHVQVDPAHRFDCVIAATKGLFQPHRGDGAHRWVLITNTCEWSAIRMLRSVLARIGCTFDESTRWLCRTLLTIATLCGQNWSA